jgi:DNA repair exonuclease SbcCD ATPase subunit
MDIFKLKEYVDQKQLELNEEIEKLEKQIAELEIQRDVYVSIHFYIVENWTEEQREEWMEKNVEIETR